MQPLNELSATQAMRRLEAGELTAERYVEACLDRIGQREGDVRAWAYLDRDMALAMARAADKSPRTGALRGMPVGVKDVFATFDQPTQYGSPIYKGHRPAADAACVAAVRAAGAVILGKTVTTEFATFAPDKTRNPHHLGHTPGGSSSGSAAAVADFMVPLAFATQTAGSTIRPASYCGIVGFKPTFGTISRAGLALTGEATLDTVGTYARSIDDIALFTAAASLRDVAGFGAQVSAQLRIGLYRPAEWSEVDPAYARKIEDAAERLKRAGHAVRELTPPKRLAGLAETQWTVMLYEISRALAHERARHAELLTPRLRAAIDEGVAIAPERYAAGLRHAEASRAAIDALFADYDLLITAAAPGEAPVGLDPTGNPLLNRLWTILHTPCLTLPVFTGPAGLPMGLQLVGPRWGDGQLLAAARIVAKELDRPQLI
ncbi:MAG: amidase [Alphaproteobacteria bacterium]